MSCELRRETEDDLNCRISFSAIRVGVEDKGRHYVAKLYALLCASSLCFLNARRHKEEGLGALGDIVRRILQSRDPPFLGNNADLSRRILDGKPHWCRSALWNTKYLNICTSSADGNGWTEERRNAELLNILTIGRRGENILTREEEVVNDLCKVWVFSHICWAAGEQWEEERDSRRGL